MATLFSIIVDVKAAPYGVQKGWAPRKRGPLARARMTLRREYRRLGTGPSFKRWLATRPVAGGPDVL